MRNLIRNRDEDEAKVSPVELFFDLVFVFAVTQLSHGLIAHFNALGALQTAMLFLGVWWVWIFTTWVTNWLEPGETPVRLMLFALMAAGLLMSIAIPNAFGERGIVFAIAYVAIQVGRSLFMLAALRGHNRENFRNFQRITVWLTGSAVFWIAGGLSDIETRPFLWAAALVIEYAGPAVGFFVPGLGRSSTRDWDIEGHHLAERCGLFIIIALGESILVTGATFAEGSWNAATIAALAAALSGSIAMWWRYFNIGAERAAAKISASDDPGRWARLIYTYIHLLYRREHHRVRRGRRARAGASRRTYVLGDGHCRDWRARRLPDRQPAFQAGDLASLAVFAPGGIGTARRACRGDPEPGSGPSGAGDQHRSDRRRGLGIAVDRADRTVRPYCPESADSHLSAGPH